MKRRNLFLISLSAISLAFLGVLFSGVWRGQHDPGESLSEMTPPGQRVALFSPTSAYATPTATFTPTPVMTPTLTPTSTPTPWALSGVIRDAQTGKALAQAKISLGDREARTDAEGAYTFQNMQPELVLHVQLERYEDQELLWRGERHLDIALQPRRTKIVVLSRFSSAPLSGVIVAGPDIEVKTDERGEALLWRLKSEDVFVVQCEGYVEEHVIYHGEEEIVLSLTPYTLQGVVHDALSGEPVEGANIALRRGDNILQVAVSDAEGRYTIRGIPSPASVVITAPGYLSFTKGVTLEAASALTVTLEPFIVKGVYIPFGLLSLRDRLLGILDLVDRTELNAVVVDVKSDRGRLAYQSRLQIAQEGKAYLPELMDLGEFLRLCRERKIYAIARIVTFKDPILTSVKPEWAVKRKDGRLYVDLEGLTWANPYQQEVRDYNIGIAKEVAAMGFDEIQFDYLRFPSDGNISDIQYAITSTMETRTKAMAEFCAQAYQELKPLGVAVSADLFGLTATIKDDRDMGIGQRIMDIAPHVDYISPMLYPSTFAKGNLGLDEPMLHPYEIVYRSCIAIKERTKTKLRPWLQHYSLYGVEYGAAEMLAEKQAANDAKTYGWLFWNAGGKYNEAVFEAEKSES